MEKCCQKQREDFAKEILDSMDSIEDENVQAILKPVKSFIRTVRDRVSTKKLPSEEIIDLAMERLTKKYGSVAGSPAREEFPETVGAILDWLDKNFPNGVEK